MKKHLLLVLSLAIFNFAFSQGYQITVKTPAFQSGISYLTYYMGNNFNISDSAAFSNSGTAIFKGSATLPPGIYAVFLPGKRMRIEFLVDKEQTFSILADTLDLINKTVVIDNKENELYVLYQQFASVKGKQIQQSRMDFMAATSREDSLLQESKYLLYNQEMNDYRDNIMKNHPNSMMTALFNAMKEPVYPKKIPISRQDSIENYNEYKTHYWDGISFMDDRIIRTPFFLKKLERYYREVMPSSADSIIKDVDYKLLLARTAPEMYKYLLNWLTDEYINPKVMGLDAVFVHLFNKYHSKGLTSWLNETQMEAISRRAYMLMTNLIGDKAANIEFLDSLNKPSPLFNVKADYTIVVFWDPHCGHCKEEVPRIDSFYRATWKNHNVKIYAVLTPDSKFDIKTDWVNFIKEKKLIDWTHVYQTREMEKADNAAQKPSFRQLYDITLTPTVYLLDKEKRIIGKKLTLNQLNDFLEVKWNSTPIKQN